MLLPRADGDHRARDHERAATLTSFVGRLPIKYSTDGAAQVELRGRHGRAEEIVLRVSNRATGDDARKAKGLVSRLTGTDAQTAYRQALEETAHRPKGSGLGLLRIAAECSMQLSVRYRSGTMVIDATSNPEPK